eukprot:INCI15886.1.p1 GENE.INCI15886.1~~INCI15886.1.p1  ORF type:complete len:355 (-),score=55.44 INCI15886.1:441-1505(-)
MFGDVYGDLPDVSESQQTEAGNTGAASANGNKNVSGVSQNSSNDNDDRAPPLPVVEAELTPKRHPRNPIVFLDVSIGGLAGGRIYIELYAHAAPLTAENFRCLCTGEKGSVTTRDGEKQLCYRGSKFHRIVQEFVLQGGDITKNTGQGGYSIYGRTFHDENFVVKHTRRGLLSMANAGRNTNGSQFFITLRDLKHLDGKHTVFGEVLFGHKIVTKIEDVGRPNGSGTPTKEVCITNCGQIRSNSTRGSTKKVKRRRSAGSDGEPSHKNTDAATSPKAGASSPPKPKVARHAGSSAPSVGEVCVKLSKFFAKDKKSSNLLPTFERFSVETSGGVCVARQRERGSGRGGHGRTSSC